jgi:SAM-dependent methyltransferase
MVCSMSSYDFGYSLTWTHAHLVPAVLFAGLTACAIWRRWPRVVTLLAGLASAWALAGFFVVQVLFGANRPMALPTSNFLKAGTGAIVDLGAGSGRSTLMVLLERPQATVTALDIYQGYFGIEQNTPDRIRANARVAGVEDRLRVQVGDMRDIPLPDDSFDGAVSAFAIDHLNREGVTKALSEAHRVLRPGGEFLFVVLKVDGWVKLAYPLPHGHGYFSGAPPEAHWRARLEQAGFDVVEIGSRPATLYLLAKARQ